MLLQKKLSSDFPNATFSYEEDEDTYFIKLHTISNLVYTYVIKVSLLGSRRGKHLDQQNGQHL